MKFRIKWRWHCGHAGRVTLPMLLCAFGAMAADVNLHVYRQVGEETPVAVYSTIVGTTTNCSTKAAEKISGAIFTHWTISAEQTFKPRDAWGRAKDAADYIPYADTTLTAHYLLETVDADGDGVADGWEYYWYGDLDETPTTDTDHDGYSFSEEIAAGTNPLFPDETKIRLDWADSATSLYNPNGYKKVTERSEPEGELFDTVTRYVKPGESVASQNKGDVAKTSFAYWTKNGVRQADAWGRATDSVSFTMPNEDVELVAHSIWNVNTRNQYYWYGDTSVALDSDLDHDGYTLAEEIAAGTNPYFADRPSTNYHGVARAMGTSVVYNTVNAHLCTFRSEPDGELFDTTSEYKMPGAKISSPTGDRLKTSFAYWTTNGVRVADTWGRSVDQIVTTMPAGALDCVAVTIDDETARMKAYWYGTTNVDLAVDTDHDGYTLVEELAAGTNPLFPDYKRVAYAGVVKDDSATKQMNLQVYEDVTGVLMGGAFTTFFASAVAGTTGEAFGAYAAPAVVDWNGDGKRDLLVAYAGGVRLFLNAQSNENPDLSEATATLPKALADAFVSVMQPSIAAGTNSVYLSDNGGVVKKFDRVTGIWSDTALTGRPGICTSTNAPSSETLVALAADGTLTAEDGTTYSVDEAMADGRSLSFGDADGDGLADILAGDDVGHIWYYKRTGETAYTLQHKVWGGTFEGFAEGLSVAAVDWDNDGDLDALVGTADGRLLLLRDPAGGRPSNLSLASGVDSVSLKWDPNAQSRIRGYYVYRSEQGADAWTRVDSTSIPRYLDKPGSGTNFDYAVSSVSRLYKTGNSRPITVESAKTDPVGVALGKVAFTWRPAAGFEGEDVTIDLAVDNARNLSAENLQLRVSFDPTVLVPVSVKKSGLTEDLQIVETRASGSWLVAGAGGEIHAGAGTFLSFVFAVSDGAKLADAQVKIEEFELKSTGSRNAVPSVLKDTGSITVGETTDGDAATVVAGSLGDLDGNGSLGWNDVELFLKWKDADQSEIPEAVRKAGDYNGDGVMDNRDYILMKRHFRVCEQKSTNGSLTGWNDHHNYKGK